MNPAELADWQTNFYVPEEQVPLLPPRREAWAEERGTSEPSLLGAKLDLGEWSIWQDEVQPRRFVSRSRTSEVFSEVLDLTKRGDEFFEHQASELQVWLDPEDVYMDAEVVSAAAPKRGAAAEPRTNIFERCKKNPGRVSPAAPEEVCFSDGDEIVCLDPEPGEEEQPEDEEVHQVPDDWPSYLRRPRWPGSVSRAVPSKALTERLKTVPVFSASELEDFANTFRCLLLRKKKEEEVAEPGDASEVTEAPVIPTPTPVLRTASARKRQREEEEEALWEGQEDLDLEDLDLGDVADPMPPASSPPRCPSPVLGPARSQAAGGSGKTTSTPSAIPGRLRSRIHTPKGRVFPDTSVRQAEVNSFVAIMH